MANSRSSNTYYIDGTTGSTGLPAGTKVVGVVLHGEGGNGTLELANDDAGASYPMKFHFGAPQHNSVHLDFTASPILFAKGVYITSATNIRATLIIQTSET